MKNQKTASFYNKFYSENSKTFTGEPSQLVVTLSELMSTGKVLEIGAGAGRNALFLASKGYEVTAIDISSVAVERIMQQAKKMGLTLETRVSDIAEENLRSNYDAIICTMTLHQLSKEDAEAVIKKMR